VNIHALLIVLHFIPYCVCRTLQRAFAFRTKLFEFFPLNKLTLQGINVCDDDVGNDVEIGVLKNTRFVELLRMYACIVTTGDFSYD